MRLKINGTNEIFSEVVEPSEKSNMITIVSTLVRGNFVKTQNSNLKLYSKNYADQVYKIVSEESQLHREPLRSYLIKIEDKIRNADKGGEISLLARYFADALRVPSASVGSNDLNMLGAANVFCWAAYTLYDDFIDGEGQIKYLSIANSAMRKSLTLLRGVFKFEEQHSLIEFLFDCMDQANAWELQETRFTVTESNIFITEIPNYGDLSILSNRAAGHIIAPLCLAIQYSFTHEQQQLLRQALHHYLVARQLNDDMHDWSEDVKNGHCTYVVSCMLRGAKIMPGEYSHSELNNLLKIYFWKHGFEELSHRALAHIELSKRSFAKTKKFNEDAKFFQFLNSIESSVCEARLRFVQKQEFLKEFKQAN
jgi:hypothetical protein